MADKFFDERLDQSEVKAAIVQRYFDAWARIMLGNLKRYGGDRIAYIDLYAGPGRYKDGSKSTPLLVLEKAIADSVMAGALVAIFNDAEEHHANSLKQAIAELPGIEKLKHQPLVWHTEVDEGAAEYFSKMNLVPTFSFLDPFGYKGLSLRIVKSVIKDFGCDTVFFFNYSRINAGITNSFVEKHIVALFGDARTRRLQAELPGRTPGLREALVLECLAEALKELGGKYVLPFRFRNSTGRRTSHFLIYVSKHPLGYKIMKGIMADESSVQDQGVPSFTYSPADASTPLLFSLCRPLDALSGMLLADFHGQTLKMQYIFEQHHIDRPYIERNYKEVLKQLEEVGRITCVPAAARRPKRLGEVTFGRNVMVTFPRIGGKRDGK